MKDNWRTLSMIELYEYFNSDDTTFVKPKFPTRRWGHVYTKTSTTNFKSLNNTLFRLREYGFEVKIEVEKENQMGKYYQIKIKNQVNNINYE